MNREDFKFFLLVFLIGWVGTFLFLFPLIWLLGFLGCG